MIKAIKTFVFLIIGSFSLSGIFSSCEDQPRKFEKNEMVVAEQYSEVPELKERGVALGSTEEMDNIQSTYSKSLEAVKKNPEDMEARLSLAEVFITEARITGKHAYNYDAALQVLDDVINSKKPTSDQKFRALMYKATVKMSLHQFQQALTLGEQAMKINDRNAGIYGVMVDANVELGNYEKAVAMSDKMINIRPDLRSYSRVSYLREIYGDVEGSKKAMEMAVEAGYPGMEQTEWARVTLGKLYEHYGDLPNAEMNYRISLRERPKYPYAMAALGNLEAKKGNYKEAEEMISTASKYINEASFHTLLGDVYRAQGMSEKAEKEYALAVAMMETSSGNDGVTKSLDGDNYDNLYGGFNHGHSHGLEIANLFMKMDGKLDDALENANVEYEVRPNNIDINKSLAMIYYEKGNMDESAKHLAKAMATNSKDPELMTLKGLLEIKNGKMAEGKKLIREALKTNPHQEAHVISEAKKILAS